MSIVALISRVLGRARPRRLGQYTLEEKIGRGGMGEVYRARHSRLRRPAAIKLLPETQSTEQAVTRFEAEVQLTAELTHPNTITIFDYGRTDDGLFYYAMQLLDGATLAEVVEVGGAQSAARVIRILERVAGALQEAHGVGLIHRDIKPANIMLTRQGIDLDSPKVLDFGLVRPIHRSDSTLTRDGTLVGTPQYMAPETIRSASEVTPKSDIYSLGAVAYFLLTGAHVFAGNTLELCAHHLHTPPAPMRDVPHDLAALVMSCLAKRPEDRPTATDFIARISLCADYGAWSTADADGWWTAHRRALGQLRASAASTSLTLTA